MCGRVLPKCLMLALALAGVVATAQAGAKPDAGFLAAALAQQESASGASLRISWTQSPAPPAKAGQQNVEVRYIRTRSVLFKEELWGEYTASGQVKQTLVVRRRYDRASGAYKEVVTSPDGKLPPHGTMLTDSKIPSRFSSTQLIDPPLFSLVAGELSKIMTAASSVSDLQEDVDGHSCWRVEIPEKQVGTAGDHYGYTMWADPTIGFCPRRLTEFSVHGDKTYSYTYSFTDYTKVGALFIPKLVTEVLDDPRAVVHEVRFQVTSADCGTEVPASELAVTIPSGTEVLVDGVYVKAP